MGGEGGLVRQLLGQVVANGMVTLNDEGQL
jgi:hypothetical protein